MVVKQLKGYTKISGSPTATKFGVKLQCRKLLTPKRSGLEIIKLEYSLKLKIKRNDWLLASSQSLRFILSLKMNSSFITSRPVLPTFSLNDHFSEV